MENIGGCKRRKEKYHNVKIVKNVKVGRKRYGNGEHVLIMTLTYCVKYLWPPNILPRRDLRIFDPF